MILAVAVAMLYGCAGTPISNFTHADLQNAQKIASTPERAAVWKAVEGQITAVEAANAAIAAQAKACVDSLKLKGPTGTVGAATIIEFAAGAANTVDANCKVIPVLPQL